MSVSAAIVLMFIMVSLGANAFSRASLVDAASFTVAYIVGIAVLLSGAASTLVTASHDPAAPLRLVDRYIDVLTINSQGHRCCSTKGNRPDPITSDVPETDG